MRSAVDWYCVVSKMLRTMLSDLQRFRVERCWDHHIDTLSIKNFKVIKIEISDRDEHGRVIPNGRASRSTRSVRTTIALSFDLNLTLLWYKCRPSSDEKHQDDGPECVSTCWHGQCTHLDTRWPRTPLPAVLQCATHTELRTTCDWSQQNTWPKFVSDLPQLRRGRPSELEPLDLSLLCHLRMLGKDTQNAWQMC